MARRVFLILPCLVSLAFGSTPIEVANAAMILAGAGSAEEAIDQFDPKVFSAEKQPDPVRRAYIEVQLQRLMLRARHGECPAVMETLDKLGGEDSTLPFTLYGFGTFMKAPHFQYYTASLQASCGDERGAGRIWVRLEKTRGSPDSADFVYPYLSAARLKRADSKAKASAGLESVRAALAKAQTGSRNALLFNEAMLLRVGGEETAALERLQAIVGGSGDALIRYLASLELREAFAPPK